jgi:4-aminobutyrate aminotransferase-like enzyme
MQLIRTYIAFDTQDPPSLVKKLKSLGVNIGTCGTQTVRLRPMLIFEEAHSQSIPHEALYFLSPVN